jgi:hypothetical protein
MEIGEIGPARCKGPRELDARHVGNRGLPGFAAAPRDQILRSRETRDHLPVQKKM